MANTTNTTHTPDQQQRRQTAPTNPASRRQSTTATWRTWRARLNRRALGGIVAVWRILPGWMKRLVVRVKAPRVSVGVCALAQDERGRLLVAHHTYRKYPWGLPGGLIGGGEQPAEALARELREELGSEVSIDALVHAEMNSAGNQMTLYYAVTLHDTPIADGIEIDGFRYMAQDEARKALGSRVDRWLATLAGRRVP